MNPLKSGRVRVLVIAGAALAAVAATGLVVANTSTAADTRWTTATATTGDVSQTYTATGSVTRKNTETATFAVSGTVNSIKVTVGEQVAAGQVLATIDSRALKLALLQAETTVAQAELNLYNAKHPSSSSSSVKKSSSSTTTKSKTGSGSASGLTTVTFNLTVLNEAVSAVNLAVVDEAKQCDAIMAWVNEQVTGSGTSTTAPTTAGNANGSSGSSAASESSAEPSASASPSSAATAPSVAAAAESPSASASASAPSTRPFQTRPMPSSRPARPPGPS